MGRQLKKMRLPNGVVAEERACGDYVCKYCGGKATACNFVADMCLQVYARHQACAGLILRLRSMWVMSRIAAPAITRTYPGNAGMKAGLPWGRVSD